MNGINRLFSKRGFTLIEMIAAALILVIAAGGTFSVYLLSHTFSERFKHRSAAYNYTARIADNLRYRSGYGDINSQAIDVSGWAMNNEVNGLTAKYDVYNVWFDDNGVEKSEATPGKPALRPYFKKIVIKIGWNERR